MSALEQQIIERLHQLGTDDQEKVLAFMESLHEQASKRYSPRELMRLPAEARDRLVAEAFDRAASMDFETFEAYSEETDDEPQRPTGRGEIWEVRFNPSEGDEIQKTRPAVVIRIRNAGRMALHAVTTITGWQIAFDTLFWMIRLSPTSANGLSKELSATLFQSNLCPSPGFNANWVS